MSILTQTPHANPDADSNADPAEDSDSGKCDAGLGWVRVGFELRFGLGFDLTSMTCLGLKKGFFQQNANGQLSL